MSGLARGVAAWGWGAAWELRRRGYALGLARPRAVSARVVSIGNLTAGGTGKTTLTLHLARAAARSGRNAAVVCRRYRPGPGGRSDEELLYRGALGPEAVFAGRTKRLDAAAAAAAGHRVILVDDGFSHWGLARDLDVVLLDATDPWGGGAFLPRGRLREPVRALQRAGLVVVTRLAPDASLERALEDVAWAAPGARMAGARHEVAGTHDLDGNPAPVAGPVWVLTATGNPEAVATSAREAGLTVAGITTRRDHHWFTAAEAHAALAEAARAGAQLLLTAKDAVRWPAAAPREDVRVLEVAWRWLDDGDALDRLILEGTS
jgi:tetraacyldisaccharide 4'-kinase